MGLHSKSKRWSRPGAGWDITTRSPGDMLYRIKASIRMNGRWCCTAITNITCHGYPSNDPQVCGGHGVCIADDVCDCYHGYFGPDCCEVPYTCASIHPEAPNVCSGHGVCKHQDDCWCFYGYSGRWCQHGQREPYTCDEKEPTDPEVCCG